MNILLKVYLHFARQCTFTLKYPSYAVTSTAKFTLSFHLGAGLDLSMIIKDLTLLRWRFSPLWLFSINSVRYHRRMIQRWFHPTYVWLDYCYWAPERNPISQSSLSNIIVDAHGIGSILQMRCYLRIKLCIDSLGAAILPGWRPSGKHGPQSQRDVILQSSCSHVILLLYYHKCHFKTCAHHIQLNNANYNAFYKLFEVQ